MSASWEPIAKRKQAEREALIPQEWRLKSLPSPDVLNVTDVPRSCGILTQRELNITEDYDATALAEAIRNKTFSCVEVTTAYCKRAAIAQQLTNCLTEIFFTAALQRAKALDHHIARHGSTLGPLHGVPISLKDTFKIATFDASIGIAALCHKPCPESAHLVNVLLAAGAVIYCKTNVPQTLAALDSINNVFGRTLNPLNRLCTAGGSSGGEGALIAMKGSPLGIGTDIGGSIRIPAMCNGLYGIKPSAHRVPYTGLQDGQSAGVHAAGLIPSAGPIARSMRDCDLLLRTIADAKPWLHDPLLIPGLWESTSYDIRANPSAPKLTIGILATDNLVTPLPPIASLLKEVSNTLSAHPSINLVHIPAPPVLATGQALGAKLMGFTGGNSMFDLLEAHSEPLIPWLKGKMSRKPAASLDKIQAAKAQQDEFCAELARTLWRTPTGEEVDAIICPIAAHPTPKIDEWVSVGYTIDWVVTDYPAGAIPVREVVERDLEGEIAEEAKRWPVSVWDKTVQKLWPEGRESRKHYLGTWLGVQVVAPRLQERRLVRCMTVIDEVLKGGSKGAARL